MAEVEGKQYAVRGEQPLEDMGLPLRARALRGYGIDTVICCAVSRCFIGELHASGIQVVPNVCGEIEDVLSAFAQGTLTDEAYRMPGAACCGAEADAKRE